MARKQQSRGACGFCGKEMTRGGMLKHLAVCAARVQAIAEADDKRGATDSIYHFQVRDAWGGDYWLNLEMPGSAKLKDLDGYLRAIWLECCGHMSSFAYIKWTKDIPMTTRIDRAFDVGTELTHIYDFGTSSETLVKAVDVRQGKPLTARPVYLMVRNTMPVVECTECDQTAQWLCMECVIETEESGLLCEKHFKKHPHKNYGPLPVVNSPRMGMCGYDGPAKPPY
jgi:hypothetical protein